MSARDEFRNHAKLFDWTMSNQWDHDIFYRGDQCIQVNYRRDDAVEKAARFWFVRVDDLRLVGEAPERHKRETVLAWLAA